jgi:RHS repeat-associated protein
VIGLNALAAGYDANGNMTLRLKDGARYFLAYDAESRLTSVSGTVSASFAYNGDGQRVTSTIGATITTYIGGYFEWQGGAGKSYYFAGAQRIAMRTSTGVEFLLGDHLGSTSLTVDSLGGNPRELRYYPWGGVRYSYGTTPTDYRFTGQQEVGYIGLYFYNSRFYDASLGRFVSPDSIIPHRQGSQAWDRYAGMNNNPIRYKDPSGHDVCDEEGNCYNRQGWYRAPNSKRLSTIDTWKMMISGKFGIEMVDSNTMRWSNTNLATAFKALSMVDKVLQGHLRQTVIGTTIKMASQGQCSGNNGPHDCYQGRTTSTGVTYFSSNASLNIPLINFIHETGHLIDMVPATANIFSGQLIADSGYAPNNPSWTKDGYVDITLLVIQSGQPVQALPMGEAYVPAEYWADAFANYVTGNIDVSPTAGLDMYNFVSEAINSYLDFLHP